MDFSFDTLLCQNTAAFFQDIMLVPPLPSNVSWINQVIYAGLLDGAPSPKTIWLARELKCLMTK